MTTTNTKLSNDAIAALNAFRWAQRLQTDLDTNRSFVRRFYSHAMVLTGGGIKVSFEQGAIQPFVLTNFGTVECFETEEQLLERIYEVLLAKEANEEFDHMKRGPYRTKNSNY